MITSYLPESDPLARIDTSSDHHQRLGHSTGQIFIESAGGGVLPQRCDCLQSETVEEAVTVYDREPRRLICSKDY